MNIERSGHERIMGQKGRRIVRESRNGKITETDNLKNLEKEELDDFNEGWCNAAGELNFNTGVNNQINNGSRNSNRRAIGNGRNQRFTNIRSPSPSEID